MKGWDVFHKIFGTLLIAIGAIFFVSPIPGSAPVIVLGLVWLIGKRRALYFLREILGKRMFKLFRIKKVVDKM